MIEIVDTVRFVLLKYKESIFTGSTEFMDSKLDNYYPFDKINPLELSEREWKYYLSLYTEKLNSIYEEDHIIIHCVYFKDKYLTEDRKVKVFEGIRLRTNKIYNEVLAKWYDYLREILPKAICIDICNQETYLADEKHHYGLAPVHYSESYYKDVLNQLEEALR